MYQGLIVSSAKQIWGWIPINRNCVDLGNVFTCVSKIFYLTQKIFSQKFKVSSGETKCCILKPDQNLVLKYKSHWIRKWSLINVCLLSTTHILQPWPSCFLLATKVLSERVASSLLLIVTDLASPPPLQPLLFLTFSDIYPPPQWQHPAHSHQPAWVSLCGRVAYSKSKMEWERRGGQAVSAKEWVRSTKHFTAAVFTPPLISVIATTHNEC